MCTEVAQRKINYPITSDVLVVVLNSNGKRTNERGRELERGEDGL